MSTQEVPEWLDEVLNTFLVEATEDLDAMSADPTRQPWYEAERKAKETILSHMIDKQEVEDVLNNIETLHWDGQVSDVTDQLRQALNLNGDE